MKVILSQVFLKSKKYQNKVVSHIDCQGQVVLEIGSGDGRLSKLLQTKAKFLYCIEVDSGLAKITKKSLGGAQNVEVINSDFRKVSLFNFKEKLIVFSSAPYHLSSKLIQYLALHRRFIAKAYLILQKEFVEKLIAPPGSKAYSLISCFSQYYGEVKPKFNISASLFSPVPKVDSVFVEIDYLKKMPFQAKDDKHLFKIITLCFQQRRKKTISILKQHFRAGQLESLLNSGLSLDNRPENLSIRDFIKISDFLLLPNK